MNDLIGRAITAAAEPSSNIRDQVAELGGTRAVAALTGRSNEPSGAGPKTTTCQPGVTPPRPSTPQ